MKVIYSLVHYNSCVDFTMHMTKIMKMVTIIIEDGDEIQGNRGSTGNITTTNNDNNNTITTTTNNNNAKTIIIMVVPRHLYQKLN